MTNERDCTHGHRLGDCVYCDLDELAEQRDRYLSALLRCASAAGNPDPATGCRLVIAFVKAVTERHENSK